jgi:hypothetical protein
MPSDGAIDFARDGSGVEGRGAGKRASAFDEERSRVAQALERIADALEKLAPPTDGRSWKTGRGGWLAEALADAARARVEM